MMTILLLLDEAHGFTTTSSFQSSNHHRFIPPVALSSSSSSTTNDGDDSSSILFSAKAKELKKKADKLRAEIAALEDSKEQVQQAEKLRLETELNQQEAYMQHYSGIVPILKPDGSVVMEQVQFPPLLIMENDDDDETDDTDTDTEDDDDDGYCSDILVYEASLPLGMILGQDTATEQEEGKNNNAMIVVDEVLPDSNGALAGIQEGDILRACTSCKVEMEQPTWQLLVGGIGRPKTMRFMLGTDDKPLETVLEALGANRMDPEARPVVLVVERPKQKKK